MANEKTSKAVASKAAKALKDPSKSTNKEIQSISGSALTQATDKKKKKK